MAELRFIGVAALQARALAALTVAVNEAAEDLVGKAQNAAPVREGTLRGSIHTDGAEVSGLSVEATVQTGGESSDYAAYIHEGHRADGSHVIGAYPNGSKYIEAPLLEESAVYRAHIAKASRAVF